MAMEPASEEQKEEAVRQEDGEGEEEEEEEGNSRVKREGESSVANSTGRVAQERLPNFPFFNLYWGTEACQVFFSLKSPSRYCTC